MRWFAPFIFSVFGFFVIPTGRRAPKLACRGRSPGTGPLPQPEKLRTGIPVEFTHWKISKTVPPRPFPTQKMAAFVPSSGPPFMHFLRRKHKVKRGGPTLGVGRPAQSLNNNVKSPAPPPVWKTSPPPPSPCEAVNGGSLRAPGGRNGSAPPPARFSGFRGPNQFCFPSTFSRIVPKLTKPTPRAKFPGAPRNRKSPQNQSGSPPQDKFGGGLFGGRRLEGYGNFLNKGPAINRFNNENFPFQRVGNIKSRQSSKFFVPKARPP